MSDRIDLHTKGKKAYDWASITKEPTGFVSPPEGEYTGVSYNSTTRKVTLSNLYGAYYHGEAIPELATGTYEIPLAHDESPTTTLFLKYNSNGFEWQTTPWNFDELQICYVCYKSTGTFCFAQREPHQFMPHSVHRELHYNIGTTRELHGGGLLTGYTPQSTTSTNRRPDIAECEVHDEDLPTLLPELTSKSYTRMYLSGASGSANFETAQTEIVSITGAIPNYNYWNGSTWGQAAMNSAQNTTYMSIWVIAVPVTDDAHSQAYRFIWMQGQSIGLEDTGLATQRALNPQDLTKGELSGISPEFVFIAQLILRYVPNPTNNWDIYEVRNIYGNKASQTGSPSGVFGDVFGPASSTDSTVALFNGTTGKSLKDGSNIYSDGTNVGIGAAPVAEKLEVGGNVKATSLVYDSNNRFTPTNGRIDLISSGNGLSWDGTNLYPNGDATRGLGTAAKRFTTLYLSSDLSLWSTAIRAKTSLSSDNALLEMYNSSSAKTIQLLANGDSYIAGGNTGFNTTSPSYKIHAYEAGVVMCLADSRAYDTADAGTGIRFQYKYTSTGTYTTGPQISCRKESVIDGQYGAGLDFYTRAHGSTAAMVMRLTGTGYLGLGGTPTEKLDIIGNVRNVGAHYICDDNFPLVYFKKIDNTLLAGMGYIVSDETVRISNGATSLTSDTKIAIKKTGEVGIGTATPAEKLDVNGNVKIQRSSAATSGTPVVSSNVIRLYASRYNSGTPTDAGMGFRHSYFSDAANKNHIEILSSINTVIGLIMNSGKIRVAGTTEPDEALDVNGDIKASGDSHLSSTSWFYFGAEATDGTWRMGRDGNNFVHQRRESGTYVTKTTILP